MSFEKKFAIIAIVALVIIALAFTFYDSLYKVKYTITDVEVRSTPLKSH